MNPQPNPPMGDEVLVFLVILALGLVAALVVVGIFFLLTLQKTLSRVSPRNRTMEPGMVWLNLVPCLNVVWQFLTVVRIAESLRNEFRDRGERTRDQGYGQGIGIASLCVGFGGAIPMIGPFFSLASLICFIIYWVQIAGYSRQLGDEEGYGRRSSAYLDYDRGPDRLGDDDRYDRDRDDDRYRDDDRDRDRFTADRDRDRYAADRDHERRYDDDDDRPGRRETDDRFRG